MAFPQTPLPIQVDLCLDGITWTNITSDVRKEQQIRITRGRSGWAQQVDFGRCSLTLSNSDGRYSPRNPSGPHFGQIGRNTPIRVSVNTGSVALNLPGQTGDYASTPDTAALDITGDIDVRVDATLLNWCLPEYPSAGDTGFPRTELIGKYASNQRSWVLYTRRGTLYFSWSTTGSGETNTAACTADLPLTPSGRLAVRATLDVDNGAAGNTVTFYTAPTISGPWNQLGAPVTGGGTTSIFSGSSSLKIGDATHLAFNPALGMVHAAEVRSGIGGTIVASPDFTAQASGTTSFADSAGRTWSLSGTTEITNRKVRFVGEVSSWTPRWDTGGKDVVCDVEAAGVLRRLSVGAVPTKSPMVREFTSPGRMSTGIVAYWPMEDGAAAASLASAYVGHPAVAYSGSVTPAAYGDWVASAPIPTVGTGSMTVAVPSYATSASSEFGFFFKVPAAGVVSTQRLVSVSTAGAAATWSVYVNTSGNLDFRAYDIEGTQILATGFGTQAVNGKEKYLVCLLTNSGSDTNYTFAVIDIADSMPTAVPADSVTADNTTGTLASYTTGRLTRVRFGQDGAMNGTAIGHLAVGRTSTAFTGTAGVLVGWNAEEGPSRVARLGRDEHIDAYATGAGDERCGVQPTDTALDIMRAAADVDEGILCEQRTVLGIRHVTRASMYNQPPALTLAYSGSDGLVAPLAPTDDDQNITNDVTVARSGGSSARAALETGPLSTLAPPDGIGLYDTSQTLNLLDDGQPPHHAGWRLHVRTWDEARYPQVTVNLANAPASIESASAMDVGSRMQITGPPGWLPPDTIDLRAEGYSEALDQFTWTLVFNCSPFGPWTVAELAVVEDFEDTTYEISMTSGGSLPWLRTSAQAHTGGWSLRSGAISNNQTSDVTVTVPAGRTELRFWYWTSSESAGPGFEGDRLLVLVDGVQVLRAQGTTPWTQAIVDVTGKSSVLFRYAKDNSTAVGSDFVAIDSVSFTGRGGHRANTAGSELLEAVTSTGTTLVVATPAGPQWTTAPVQLPIDMTVGGETLRVPAISSWAADAFGRTVSGGWGTADSGQTWMVVGGTVGTDFAIGSGYGQHILTTTNASRRCGLDFLYADVDVYVSVTTSATATGGSLYGGPVVRYVDADNLYMLRIEFTTGNAINLDVRKRVATVESSIGTYASPLTHVAGTFVRCRFQVFGSLIRAKVWAVAAPEPPEWHVIVTDTSIATSNYVGARSISAAGNTNVNSQIRYDNYEVVNPQKFTSVTRSTNSVVKSHAAGAPISLAQPAYAPL